MRALGLLLTAVAIGTSAVASAGQAPVDLGAGGTFAILSKTGVTNVYVSAVTRNVGSSPITGAAILVTCTEVAGTIFAIDAAGPLPCTVNAAPFLTSPVLDMEAAYLDAEGRPSPDFTEVGAGETGGMTLPPSLCKWGMGVMISMLPKLRVDGRYRNGKYQRIAIGASSARLIVMTNP